jgi:hypothetical protein
MPDAGLDGTLFAAFHKLKQRGVTMKYYHPTGPAQEVRLGQRELINAGEEILNRARVLSEALRRKIENAVHHETSPNRTVSNPRAQQER